MQNTFVKKVALKMLMKLTPKVDFTNTLCAALTPADHKTTKTTDNLTVFFAHLGSLGIKAACKTLTKLIPKVNPNKLLPKRVS
jgi:hypothetical protein